jgi:hypothetical protein
MKERDTMATAIEQLRAEDPMSGCKYSPATLDVMLEHAFAAKGRGHLGPRWRLGRRTAAAATVVVMLGGGALAGAAIANSGQHLDVPDLGYHYAVPPVGTTPAITAKQATEIYLQKELAHNGPGPTSTPDSVTLVELSAPSSPIGPLSARLVWLVQFDNAPIIQYGPGNSGGRTGTWDGVIDASTGDFLLLYNTSP